MTEYFLNILIIIKLCIIIMTFYRKINRYRIAIECCYVTLPKVC